MALSLARPSVLTGSHVGREKKGRCPPRSLEAEVSAAASSCNWAMCSAHDAAFLPFGMVGELRRKLSPITTLVLFLLFMGVGMMNIRV